MWGGGFSNDYSAPDVGFSGGGLDGFANDGYGAPAGWDGGTGGFAGDGANSNGGYFSGTQLGYNALPGGNAVTFNGPAPARAPGPGRQFITGHSQQRTPYAPDASWIERNAGALIGGLAGLAIGGPIGMLGGARGGDWLHERIRNAGLDEDDDPDAATGPNARYNAIADTNDQIHDFWMRLGDGDVDYTYPESPMGGTDGDSGAPTANAAPAPAAGLDDAAPADADVGAAPAPNPLLAPELLYGPYFDPATGGFTRGAAPFQNIADRYRVTRAGV